MTASFADNEIWHVLVASDDMKRMNVDQLDDAFRLSLVDASTLVWKAGMKTWQRLGSVAGIEDEPEEPLPRRAPPPPPPPIPAPRRATAAAFATTAPNPFLAPPGAFPAPNPFTTTAPNPFAATVPVQSPFAPPQLKAPVYTPPLRAPDPYVLPKRRASAPSEVDFRRSSGGVRFGRWLVVGLLLTGGVLALYRQNLLREGARRVGIENKYLHGERRVTSYVDAKAPASVKRVLAQLKLLPGPNAILPTPAVKSPPPPAPAAPVVAATPPAAAAASASAPAASAPKADDVKTVSLDSLPVEGAATAAEAEPPAAKAAPLAKATPAPKPAAKLASAPRGKAAPKAEKPAKVAVEKPRAAPKPAPPPANENPLKAAIRSAIAADSAKK